MQLTKMATPRDLEETERKHEYHGKKYHSGTICDGVLNLSTGMKLSLWCSVSAEQ